MPINAVDDWKPREPYEGQRRTEPLPMLWMQPGKTYFGDSGNTPERIDPTEVAMYVHCQSGLTPLAFIRWLCEQLETLDAIDPDCSK